MKYLNCLLIYLVLALFISPKFALSNEIYTMGERNKAEEHGIFIGTTCNKWGTYINYGRMKGSFLEGSSCTPKNENDPICKCRVMADVYIPDPNVVVTKALNDLNRDLADKVVEEFTGPKMTELKNQINDLKSEIEDLKSQISNLKKKE